MVLFITAGVMSIVLPVLTASSAFALDANTSAVCQGVGLISGASDCAQPANSTSVDSILSTTINIMSIVAGIIAVIMIIVGGIKYTTSSGDSNRVNSAKNTILFAIIGLVVAALAQAIAHFVLHKAA